MGNTPYTMVQWSIHGMTGCGWSDHQKGIPHLGKLGSRKVWVGSAWISNSKGDVRRDTGMYSLFPPFLNELNHIIPLTGSSLDLRLCEDHLGFCPVILHKSLCYFCKRCQRYALELTVFQPRPLGSTVASRSKSSWSRNSRGQDIWDYPPSYLQLCFALKNLNVHSLVKVISPNEIYSEERGPAKWCSPLDASHSIHTEEIWNPGKRGRLRLVHGQMSQGEDPLTEHCLWGGNKPNQVGAAKVVDRLEAGILLWNILFEKWNGRNLWTGSCQ